MKISKETIKRLIKDGIDLDKLDKEVKSKSKDAPPYSNLILLGMPDTSETRALYKQGYWLKAACA